MSDTIPAPVKTLTLECKTLSEIEAAVAAVLAMRAIKEGGDNDEAVVLRMVFVGGKLVSTSRKVTLQRNRYVQSFDKAMRALV
jgi:hypothetical protein